MNMLNRVPLNVLIVEDDPGVRSALRASARLGFESVAAAASLKEALLRARSFDPDIVLTDFNLPDADGTATVPALRFRHPRAAIIGMSGDPANEPIMLRLGAEGFLAKPFGIDEFIALVRRVMPTPSPEFDLPTRMAA